MYDFFVNIQRKCYFFSIFCGEGEGIGGYFEEFKVNMSDFSYCR